MRSSVRLSAAFGVFGRGRAWTPILGLAALAIMCGAAPAPAQETGGSIAGTISDAQNATLPGVAVSLRNEGTNAQPQTGPTAKAPTCCRSSRSGATPSPWR
jgi:hypothetical protein